MNDGVLGEAKALTYFVALGYDVFTQFAGKAPFDLAVHKNGKIYRVSVKSTTYRELDSWIVQLRQNSINRPFDRTASDLLVVYIVAEDRIVVYESAEVTNEYTLRIRANDAKEFKSGRKSLLSPLDL